MNCIRITLFRANTTTGGIEVGVYRSEEEAGKAVNRILTNMKVLVDRKIIWHEHTGSDGSACAMSEILTFASVKFKDVEPQNYFMFADDIQVPSAPCTCGQQAFQAHRHRWFKCDFCSAPEFYYHHCKGWGCGRLIDSRIHKKCGACGWYICAICGTCNCN